MDENIVNLKSLHVLPGGVMQPTLVPSTMPEISATTSSNTIDVSQVIKDQLKGLTIQEGSLELSNYLDYRHYLQDFYKMKREQTKRDLRPYNYAVFSAAANIKSPNYLKMIIEGKRNLSPDMIGKFAKALNLNKEQGEEFRLLVLHTQSTEPAERNLYLKDLNDHRVNTKLKSGEINQKAYEKVPNWITWVLYTMIDQQGVKFQPEKLKDLLRNKANTEEIRLAMKALLESGRVEQNEITGELNKKEQSEAQEEIPVQLVRKLQTELMYLGLESLFQDEPTEREFGSLTLSLTKSEFEQLKFQLRKIRKEINKDNSIARMKSKGERVYQLNLQLFPVTSHAIESEKA